MKTSPGKTRILTQQATPEEQERRKAAELLSQTGSKRHRPPRLAKGSRDTDQWALQSPHRTETNTQEGRRTAANQRPPVQVHLYHTLSEWDEEAPQHPCHKGKRNRGLLTGLQKPHRNVTRAKHSGPSEVLPGRSPVPKSLSHPPSLGSFWCSCLARSQIKPRMCKGTSPATPVLPSSTLTQPVLMPKPAFLKVSSQDPGRGGGESQGELPRRGQIWCGDLYSSLLSRAFSKAPRHI